MLFTICRTNNGYIHDFISVWRSANEVSPRSETFTCILKHPFSLMIAFKGVMKGELTAAQVELRFRVFVHIFEAFLMKKAKHNISCIVVKSIAE